MIGDGFSYLASVVALAALVVALERFRGGKFFEYVPAVVLLYFGAMVLATAGLWENTAGVKATYGAVKGAVLPAMIFLMLLRCDLRKIVRLGPRMLLAFFCASASIGVGFIVTYGLLRRWYEPDTWKTFAALCGSWMGGTGNMVAIQGALNVPDSRMGYALIMDSVNYAVWVMALLAFVPAAKRFNRWAKADTAALDAVGARLAADQGEKVRDVEFADLMVLLGAALAVGAGATAAGAALPATAFLTAATWTVILATLAGVGGALTPLGRLPGTGQLAQVLLYVLVGLIASRASVAELGKAPLYIASGFLVIGIHATLMVAAARVFRLDLFSLGVASLANIGGVASAPILAAAYSDVLVPVGVLMAMLGYVVGTGGGLLVGTVLSWM